MHMYVPILNFFVTICIYCSVCSLFRADILHSERDCRHTLSVSGARHRTGGYNTVRCHGGSLFNRSLRSAPRYVHVCKINIACVVQYTVLTFMWNIFFVIIIITVYNKCALVPFETCCILLAGVALELPTQPLVYSSSQSYDCGLVTIINDTATTGDRTTMLGIESDQFQVSDNVTALTVLDEQS